MKIPAIPTVDFETHPIEARPHYPPKPVGVSILLPGEKKAKYYAWGHPTENNCSLKDGIRAVKAAYNHTKEGVLFHNGKFDVDVAETHLSIPLPPRERIHDTMFLLFLDNPHALDLKLKPSAFRLFGMAAEEQDAILQWAIREGLLARNAKNAGHLIWRAPGKLVGDYANGDTIRTAKIFKYLYPKIVERGMLAAYQREQRLMPYLLKNEREGIRVDQKALEEDLVAYEKATATVEAWVRKYLKTPDLNLDSDRELAAALEKCDAITEWTLTPTGQKSVSKKFLLPEHFRDPKLSRALGYHSRLGTCMGTFMRPWIAMAQENGGIIHTNWRQVKGSGGANADGGARSNRLQSSPNFQNIPKTFEDKGDDYEHPAHIKSLPTLPLMRRYVLPDSPKHWLGRRDYNQQELRILAHFEDGLLLQAYLENPRLDVHVYVQQKIKEMAGLDLPRGPVKILNFGMLYGMGMAKLAARIKQDYNTAKKLKAAQMMALPGVKGLDKELKWRGGNGQAIRTWGGREYFCEEPKIINGRRQTFEYKLLNYLIQGSAADCTKEALIRYGDLNSSDSRFLLTVHDEIDISAPKGAFKREMLRLRECMMGVEFDLPMLSDAEFGPRWSELEKLKEPSPF